MAESYRPIQQEYIRLNRRTFHSIAGELTAQIEQTGRDPEPLKDFLFGSVPSFHDRGLGHANVTIKYGEKKYTYRTIPPPIVALDASDIPTIAVTDLPRFADGLIQLASAMFQKRHLPWLYKDIFWQESANLRKIWYNATPYDLAHPEEFVKKIADFLCDETFVDLNHSRNLGVLSTLDYQMIVENSHEAEMYETPYAFDFHLIPASARAIANDVGRLPLVRYGIHRDVQKQRVATIYAVQNPRQNAYSSNGEQMAVVQSQDSETIRLEQERKKLMRKLYKVDTNDPKFNQKDPDEEELLHVSRPAIVSLLASCVLLKNRGIYTAQIPTFLPLRWQDHVQKDGREKAEEFQYRATDSLIRLIERVARQVPGIVLDVPVDEEQAAFASYLTVHLPKNASLTAKNPILQEVIHLCEGK